MDTWLDSFTKWAGGSNLGNTMIAAGTAGAWTPAAALIPAGLIVNEYTKNERRKRDALRTGNKEAYAAAVRASDEILARADAADRAAIKAEAEALGQWDEFVKLGEQGQLDLKQFNANPTAYIKSRTNFDAEAAEIVKAVEKGAAARGDLLGTETIAREAIGTADLMSKKRMEAMDNINQLLGLGKYGTEGQAAVRRDFDAYERDRNTKRDEITAWLAGQEQIFHKTNRDITAKRYADANALTMNMINTAANLGMAGATLATGIPTPKAPVASPTPPPNIGVTPQTATYQYGGNTFDGANIGAQPSNPQYFNYDSVG